MLQIRIKIIPRLQDFANLFPDPIYLDLKTYKQPTKNCKYTFCCHIETEYICFLTLVVEFLLLQLGGGGGERRTRGGGDEGVGKV